MDFEHQVCAGGTPECIEVAFRRLNEAPNDRFATRVKSDADQDLYESDETGSSRIYRCAGGTCSAELLEICTIMSDGSERVTVQPHRRWNGTIIE